MNIRQSSGFLLLEVIMSVTLIAVTVLLIGLSYSASKKAVQFSGEVFKYSILLEAKMWSYEDTGEAEEGEEHGRFRDDDGYLWNFKAVRLEKSRLNLARLDVSSAERPKDETYFVSTYLKNSDAYK